MTSPGGGGVTATITYEGDLQGGFNAVAFKEAFRSRGVQLITTIPGNKPFYVDLFSAISQPDRLDEVGAVYLSTEAPYPGLLTGPEAAAGITIAPPRELMRARLKATAAGTVTFTPDVTNIVRPFNDTLIYGFRGAIPASNIDVGTPKTLTIVGPPPYVANPDSATVAEDSNETAIDVLANDTVVAGQTKQLLSVSQPAHGTVVLNGNSLSYKPAANFFGTDTFTYTGINSLAPNPSTAATATVTITVSPSNDAPTLDAIADPAAILEDAGEQTIGLTGISAGPGESQDLSVTAISSNPELTGNIPVPYLGPNGIGSLTFTPAANQSGTATITVTVQDDAGDMIVRTFNVSVIAVNDAPAFAKGANQESTDESGAVTVAGWATAISAGPPDESNQSLTFSVVPDNADLFSVTPSIDGSGNLSYTPAPNVEGVAIVSVVLSDNGGVANGGVNASASQTFEIRIVKLHWAHNTAKPQDTTGDTAITAIDALSCINYINAHGAGEIPPGASSAFLDVNADGSVTAIDPLTVINYLNAHGPDNGTNGGEGEAASAESAAADLALTDPTPTAASAPQATGDSDVMALLALDSAQQRARRHRR
jgi:hypothetical protein